MNDPAQGQARNAQPAGAPAETMTASQAASILAKRRSELRQQEPPTEIPGIAEDPAEDAALSQPEGELEDGAGPQDESADPAESEQPDEGQAQDEDSTPGDDAILELDGEEHTLAEVKEWQKGHMRQDDYQRKTAALAQQHQAVTVMETQLNQYAHAANRWLQVQMQQAATDLRGFESVDWARLAGENPQQYTAQKARFDAAKERFQSHQQQWQGFLSEYEQLSQRQLQARAHAALPELRQRIKGWNDALYNDLASFAVEKYGADRGVLNKVTDPWFWQVLHDAKTLKSGQSLPKVKAKVKRTTEMRVTGRPPEGKTAQKRTQTAAIQGIAALTGKAQINAAADLLARRRQAR
jgi:hypothetical protein